MSIAQGPFTITLTGLHFAQGAVGYLGTTALTTTYVSSTQLTAAGTATSAQAGTQTITAHNPDPGASISAGVNIVVKGGVAVVVTPATGTVRTGNQQVFTATVTGALDPSVTWTVNGVAGGNSTIGTIAANGTVTVFPKTATLGAGNVQQFQVTVTGTIDLSVVWSVNGVNYGNSTVGRIDYWGNYTAPDNIQGLGSVTVTATSNANAAKSDSATVTLTNPAPILTSITPATLGLGAFQMTLNGTGF